MRQILRWQSYSFFTHSLGKDKKMMETVKGLRLRINILQ